MKEKDTSFYTKLTYEHKCIEDFGPEVISLSKCAWDMSGEDLMNMFFKIWVAAGYPADGFKNECANWVENYE